jgi:hypothetical protein
MATVGVAISRRVGMAEALFQFFLCYASFASPSNAQCINQSEGFIQNRI